MCAIVHDLLEPYRDVQADESEVHGREDDQTLRVWQLHVDPGRPCLLLGVIDGSSER